MEIQPYEFRVLHMMGEVKVNGNQGEIINNQDPTGEKQA